MLKIMHFRNVLFSKGKRPIRENTCFEQQARVVDSLGDSFVFRIFKLPCASTPERRPKLRKKGSFWAPIL